MASCPNRETLPEIDSIETDTTTVPQTLVRSSVRESREWPATVIRFEHGGKVAFIGNPETDENYAEYFHPDSPTETTAFHSIGDDPASEALDWIATYSQATAPTDLYDEFRENDVNALLGREFETALDLFE